MFGRRLINAGGVSCTTDTLQILGDTSCVATYRLNGNATDLSGNYNGTATSVTYVAGKFDDAGSFNNNISRSVIDLSITLGSVKTISHWIKFNEFQSDNMHIFSSSSNNLQLVLLMGSRNFAFYDGVSTKQFGSAFPNNFDWHHLVWVLNGTNTSLYLDDNLVSTITTASTTQTDVVIGSNSALSGVRGLIDQVRIFNKAISAAEVTTLYNEVAC